MVSITSLWLPIVLGAIAVFAVSSVIHMVLTHHRTDFSALPNEEEVMETVGSDLAPGGYMFPYSKSPSEMGTPEMLAKFNKGPIAFLTVFPKGPPVTAKHLTMWFLFCLAMGVLLAYLAGRSLPAGTPAMQVFRFVGTAGWLGYGFGGFSDSIWKGQSWIVTVKNAADGLVYALVTAAIFGWLWPA